MRGSLATSRCFMEQLFSIKFLSFFPACCSSAASWWVHSVFKMAQPIGRPFGAWAREPETVSTKDILWSSRSGALQVGKSSDAIGIKHEYLHTTSQPEERYDHTECTWYRGNTFWRTKSNKILFKGNDYYLGHVGNLGRSCDHLEWLAVLTKIQSSFNEFILNVLLCYIFIKNDSSSS